MSFLYNPQTMKCVAVSWLVRSASRQLYIGCNILYFLYRNTNFPITYVWCALGKCSTAAAAHAAGEMCFFCSSVALKWLTLPNQRHFSQISILCAQSKCYVEMQQLQHNQFVYVHFNLNLKREWMNGLRRRDLMPNCWVILKQFHYYYYLEVLVCVQFSFIYAFKTQCWNV